MGTWYCDEYAYYPTFTQHLDETIHRPEMLDVSLGFKEGSSLFACRLHGNPNCETANIARQDSVSRMREQDDVYRAEVVKGGGTFAFAELFDVMPDVWKKASGFHIIDIDEPMLAEQGEAAVHEHFTDYLVDSFAKPEESRDAWDKLMRSYLFKHFVNRLAEGVVPPGVAVEPVRHVLGFPYEWHGAPID